MTRYIQFGVDGRAVAEALSSDGRISSEFEPCPADLADVPMAAVRKAGGVIVRDDAGYMEIARAAKLAAVHAEKCRVRDAGFLVGGTLFDSDLPARTAYAELALTLQQEPTLSTRWRASEGQWVQMDAALFEQVHASGRAHIEGCFGWQEAREQEIAAATTLAELEAVSEVYTAPEA